MKKWMNYLAPFSIVGLIAIFVWNVATHGQIDHPGKFTYEKKCAGCHGDKGEGIETLIPPLYAADFMPSKTLILCLVSSKKVLTER
jgi:cytochrome c